jgi:hypothetical protein
LEVVMCDWPNLRSKKELLPFLEIFTKNIFNKDIEMS